MADRNVNNKINDSVYAGLAATEAARKKREAAAKKEPRREVPREEPPSQNRPSERAERKPESRRTEPAPDRRKAARPDDRRKAGRAPDRQDGRAQSRPDERPAGRSDTAQRRTPKTAPARNVRPENGGSNRSKPEKSDRVSKKAPNKLLKKIRHGLSAFGKSVANVLSAVGAVISDCWRPFVLSFLAIVLAVSGILFLLSLTGGKADRIKIPDEITVEEFGKARKADALTSKNGRMLYADADSIFSYFGSTISGDRESITVLTASGETASFTNGSDEVLVNGSTVHMGYPAVVSDYRLMLPVSFITDFVTGVSAMYDPEKATLVIERNEDSDGVGFSLKSGAPMEKIPLDSEHIKIIADDVDLSYEFKNDFTKYLQFMNPENRDDYLILISPSNPDDGSFVPSNLMSVTNARKGYTSLKMEATAQKALEALFIEMKSEGFSDMAVNMAYRSFQDQQKTFDNYVYNERYYSRFNYESTGKRFSDEAYSVLGSSYLQSQYISKGTYVLSKKDAERVVSTYSAVPGTGDHQTGLGVDMHDMKTTSKDFATHDAYLWLKENAYKFGFIERFPEGKEKITGFAYEPYHWRFVGQYHAAKMHAEGVCLEEYIAALAN